MTQIARVCIDTSKSVFALHGLDAQGRAVVAPKLSEAQMNGLQALVIAGPYPPGPPCGALALRVSA